MPFAKSLFGCFGTSFGIDPCGGLACSAKFLCRRVAGREPDHQERDQQDSEQRWNHQQQAFDQIRGQDSTRIRVWELDFTYNIQEGYQSYYSDISSFVHVSLVRLVVLESLQDSGHFGPPNRWCRSAQPPAKN